jgi:hypothetical protein
MKETVTVLPDAERTQLATLININREPASGLLGK